MRSYLEQARRNQDVAEELFRGETSIHYGWAVTCIFYAAVHYANEHIQRRGYSTPRDHGTREWRVSQLMKPIYEPYKWLKAQSETARYDRGDPDEELVAESREKIDEIREFIDNELPHLH